MIFNSRDETVPPHRPGFDALFIPSTGIPSFHQLSLAGGLLELESQISAASIPGTNSAGSTRILTVSGATVARKRRNRYYRSLRKKLNSRKRFKIVREKKPNEKNWIFCGLYQKTHKNHFTR